MIDQPSAADFVGLPAPVVATCDDKDFRQSFDPRFVDATPERVRCAVPSHAEIDHRGTAHKRLNIFDVRRLQLSYKRCVGHGFEFEQDGKSFVHQQVPQSALTGADSLSGSRSPEQSRRMSRAIQ